MNESGLQPAPSHATTRPEVNGLGFLRADGSIISRRQSGFLWASLGNVRLMPGDAIVVPEDFERTTWMKDLKDWAQIFFQFGLGVAALEVLRD